jgi:hypothetical protein
MIVFAHEVEDSQRLKGIGNRQLRGPVFILHARRYSYS